MSFILDALKKSESDRQRQAGPALYEVRVAAPRSRFPVWGIVLSALLGVNAVVLGAWLLLRAPHAPRIAVAAPASLPPPPAAAPVAAAAPAVTPPTTTPAPATPGTAAASVPRDPQLAALDPATDSDSGSVDNEPAVESAPAGAAAAPAPAIGRTPLPGSHVRTEPTGLPTRDQLQSSDVASLPELRLDLHVYDPDPSKRFVLINMRRLREGDSLPGGLRVEHITDAGAEVEYHGIRFLLPHE